jgi:ribosome-associated toxin RatA of RatAB toxin-antitoxin module
MEMRLAPLLALVGLAAAAPSALAARVALHSLPPEDSLKLAPLAGRGELALVESHADGRLRQITVYAIVNAPPDKAEYVVGHPAEYPDFVPSVVKSKISSATPDGTLYYDWELDVPLVNLKGQNRLSFGKPAIPGSARTIEVETLRGDVPSGAWHWEFLPLGDGRTLVACHTYADIAKANWFLRKMIAANRTIEHGSVLASTVVFVKAVKLRAEALAGHGDGHRPKVDQSLDRAVELKPVRGTFDPQVLDPLLARGPVALIESFPDGRLRLADLLSYVYAPQAAMFRSVSTPTDFSRFVPGVDKSNVLSDNGREALYELEIHVPVLPNINYKTRMVREPEAERVRQHCVAGDARGSVYGWDLISMGPKQTLAIYQLNGQLRKQSWFLRQMIKSEPFYEHGLNVSVALATMMAMRGHAEGWK